MRVVVDLETPGLRLEAKCIFCIAAKDIDTQEEYFFDRNIEGDIEKGVKFLLKADELIGHNLTGFDIPVLENLYPEFKDYRGKITDTLVMSRLLSPYRFDITTRSAHGGHSVGAWTKRLNLGIEKVAIEDYSIYTEEVARRCKNDVLIEEKIYYYLLDEKRRVEIKAKHSYDDALAMETLINRYQSDQEYNGFYFNKELAENIENNIRSQVADIDSDLQESLDIRQLIRPKLLDVDEPRKKDGSYKKSVVDCFTPESVANQEIDGAFSRIMYITTNLDSDMQLKKLLLRYGWKPTQWNYKTDARNKPIKVNGTYVKTSPKITEDSLDELVERVPGCHKLVLRSKLSHRLGLIQSLRLLVRDDSRIEARANPVGTNTYRYCVTADTKIVTDCGLRSIVEVQKGDQVLTHDGQYHKVLDWFYQGIRPVLQIVTEEGNIIKCSRNHPFMTDKGWVKAEDLRVGDVTKILYSTEAWVELKQFSGILVSSLGRIRRPSTGWMPKFRQEERRMPLHQRGTIDVYTNTGVKQKHRIGYLVMLAFVGERPAGHEVCHKDGNPTNNILSNLYYGTSYDNSQDAKLHGRMIVAKHNRRNCKLTQDHLDKLWEELDTVGFSRGFDTKWAKIVGCDRKLINIYRLRGKRILPIYTKRAMNRYYQEFKTARVKSILELPEEPLYDISVDSAHSYVAEGYVTHNTHRGLVNIPKNDPHVLLGREFRSLFSCPKGKILVGVDADALEMRIAAHDMNDPIFIEDVLSGSIHDKNMERFGIDERKIAKALGFGVLFGAGIPRVMEITGFEYNQAADALNRIYDSLPSLKQLKLDLENYYEHYGHVLLFDGRMCVPANRNAALNARIQGNGVIFMKTVLCFIMKYHKDMNIEPILVGNFHDELIFETIDDKSHVETLKAIIEKSFEDATKYLNIRLKMTGTPKEGYSWAEIK